MLSWTLIGAVLVLEQNVFSGPGACLPFLAWVTRWCLVTNPWAEWSRRARKPAGNWVMLFSCLAHVAVAIFAEGVVAPPRGVLWQVRA